jgi:hypothetical protein
MEGRRESECRAQYVRQRDAFHKAKARGDHNTARHALEAMTYYKSWLIVNSLRVPTDLEEE